ncbi:glyoxalase/bleomycin resistance protein/dioxygenase superfamily protein [Mumia flava]|uniref:Glyoxalase/bleomycin resistance protein/dioxygenase superfamily protein n=1 Tax=Mumia flava TaxID=1348852 RepID=A0A0B2B9S6_9ACTN|nr:VOC family protein [Mumia flava]PJJ48245.1 glyoxalase/bleomycin resistance protein/dioxygenase superfamily protein [Mumia flava]
MGIDRIESVTYEVDDLEECVRFFVDFGLALRHRDDERAELSTLVGQTFHLMTAAEPELPAPLEAGPTIREVVWGVDSPESLERLVAAVGTDRTVRWTDDGVAHFADESGFGVGLTVARPVEPQARDVAADNRWGAVGRWNDSVVSTGQVRPIRMCHVALNIEKAGAQEATDFYLDRLGFRATDIVKPMGTFMQAEGDDDQHNLLLCHRPDRAGANHVSFEVPSFDDVIEGGNHMIERGWREARRLGRHTVGSNVFRFLHAPCGGRVEYAADMDRVDDSYETRVHEETPPHHVWTLRTNRDAEQPAEITTPRNEGTR